MDWRVIHCQSWKVVPIQACKSIIRGNFKFHRKLIYEDLNVIGIKVSKQGTKRYFVESKTEWAQNGALGRTVAEVCWVRKDATHRHWLSAVLGDRTYFSYLSAKPVMLKQCSTSGIRIAWQSRINLINDHRFYPNTRNNKRQTTLSNICSYYCYNYYLLL